MSDDEEWTWKKYSTAFGLPLETERDTSAMDDLMDSMTQSVMRLLDRDFNPWKYPDPNWAARIGWDQLVAPRITWVQNLPSNISNRVDGYRLRLAAWIYPGIGEF